MRSENGLLVVSTLLEPCPCPGLSGSPFAWSGSAGMSLVPGVRPVSWFPHSATRRLDWAFAIWRNQFLAVARGFLASLQVLRIIGLMLT